MNNTNSNNLIEKSRREKIFLYFLSPIIVLFIYMLNYALKGIYPFGAQTIDYYDMGQEVVALYYHIYDSIHGTKSIFFDWYTALGMNMSNGTSGCSNINPFNLFLLFVKREYLLESMSYFLIIKSMCMTLTFAFGVDYICKKTPTYIQIALSVGYGLCGYVMMHYTIMTWLDVAALFPLLIYFTVKLIREGKIIGYVITLSLSFVISYYLSSMILIFLFVGYGLYVSINKIIYKNSVDRHLMQFGLGTGISMSIAAIVLVPQLKQMFSSSRFGNNTGIKDILFTYESPYEARIWAVLGLALAFSIIIIGIINDIKKNRRAALGRTIWIVVMIFTSSAELFFENINLIMHFGSYVHYPIRNGFIIYFTIGMSAAYYAQNLAQEPIIKEAFSKIVSVVMGLGTIVVCLATIYWYQSQELLDISTVIKLTKYIGIAYAVIFVIILLAGNRKLNMYVIPMAVVCQLLIYSYLFIGPISFITHYAEEPEQEAEYIRISNELSKEFDISPSFIDRIKNPDESLNANYGLVLRRPTLSNGTHLVKNNVQDTANMLGYSIQFTRLLDAGGTAFTDAMLHETNAISCLELDDSLYTLLDSTDTAIDHMSKVKRNYYYYAMKYQLPFVMKASNIDELEAFNEASDVLTFHNQAYKLISSMENGITSNSDFARAVAMAIEGDNFIHVDGKQLLYYYGGMADNEYRNISISIDGKVIPVPSIHDVDNNKYPAHFNNNALYLGEYEDCDLNIAIEVDRSIHSPEYLGGILSIDACMLEDICNVLNNEASNNELCATNDKLSFNVEGVGGEYAIIPVQYDEGFSARVNGKKVNSISIQGLFTAIPLFEGVNNIELAYMPSGIKTGLIISIIGIILLITICVFGKVIVISDAINNLLEWSYIAVWSLVIFGLYFVTIIIYMARMTGII